MRVAKNKPSSGQITSLLYIGTIKKYEGAMHTSPVSVVIKVLTLR